MYRKKAGPGNVGERTKPIGGGKKCNHVGKKLKVE